jgi:hypothetical protein
MVGLGCFTEYIICRRRSCGAIASLCLGVSQIYIYLAQPRPVVARHCGPGKSAGESCWVKEFGERSAGDTNAVGGRAEDASMWHI